MSDWKKFNNTQEQLDEIRNSPNGFIARCVDASYFKPSEYETPIIIGLPEERFLEEIIEYRIV